MLDDNQLAAFLSREATRLEIRQLDPDNRLFASIAAFLKCVDVIENELLDPNDLPDPFGSVLRRYYETLDRYRLLTYGQQVVRAVRELEQPELAADVHSRLRHLVVDEHQDVNPAQERQVQLLTGPQVQLCVVGDDQQAIYQWRGSDVSSIVTFPRRYPSVATFEITTNRRSRPQLVEVANRFARTIPDRIDKVMRPHRPAAGGAPAAVVWSAQTETEEAGWVANLVLDLVDAAGGRACLSCPKRSSSGTPWRGWRTPSGGTRSAPPGPSPTPPSSPGTSGSSHCPTWTSGGWPTCCGSGRPRCR